MPRLLIHVEGSTEETFVNEFLRSHLLGKGYDSVSARIVGNARLRERRGGIRPWSSVKRDITNHLRQDTGCTATTMVDFYGLPQSGSAAWPGRLAAVGQGVSRGAEIVESALMQSVVEEMGDGFDQRRFVPFVVIHEFEGLLFSDCQAFGVGIGRPDLKDHFQTIRDSFETPEHINDSPTTAPSKRIEQLVPNYEKPLLGTLAALEIGLAIIRKECGHFADWLSKLESIAI
jgi:hypothetical protein